MPLTTDIEKAKVFLVVDVANLVWRAAMSPGPVAGFTNSQKYPTGYMFIAVAKIMAALQYYGLSKNLPTCLVLSAQENSDARRKHYPGYKAGRTHKEYQSVEVTDAFGRLIDKTPNPIEDFMELMCCLPSVNLIMPDMWETDDAIASFVTQTKKSNKTAIFYVLTNDRDDWALMHKRVVITSKPKAEFSIKDLETSFKITNPKLLPLAKTLFGDDSDKIKKVVHGLTESNIPHGFLDTVRPKKKQHAVDAFLERVAEHVRTDPKSSLKKALGMSKELKATYKIAKLRRNLKLHIVRNQANRKKLQQLLSWYELKSQSNNMLNLASSFGRG
jgi:hypothetical protein